MSSKITILGGGAWGSALAQMASQNERPVHLYVRDPDVANEINHHHSNHRYLGPNILLNKTIRATAHPEDALSKADFILAAIPAQSLRHALENLAPFIPPQAILILCAKGIERGSQLFMSQMAGHILPHQKIAVLSGPSFASDVARGLPTAVTMAAKKATMAHKLAHIFSSPSFRCYASDDVIGVEVGGAVKNVLALAAGIAAGRGLGLSAQAALITRGFAELRRIGAKLGGRLETMSGLSVLGDLILTCSSPQSRNYAYGMAMGQGKRLGNLPLAEGVATAPVAARLCDEWEIDAPIIHTVSTLLERFSDKNCGENKMAMDDAIYRLINRPLKFED